MDIRLQLNWAAGGVAVEADEVVFEKAAEEEPEQFAELACHVHPLMTAAMPAAIFSVSSRTAS